MMSANLTKSSNVNSGRSKPDGFIETSRALEHDEDGATFKAKLAVIARQKPIAEPKRGDRE
jgi:hypothetical protein